VTPAAFRRIALGFDGAIEKAHMGHPDFRAANGKIFATLGAIDAAHGMVKLTPDQQKQFVADHPAAFAPVNGAWGLGGATIVTLAKVDAETLGEAMTIAWQNVSQLVASRRVASRKPASRKPANRKPANRKR
jgi:hypothetical protein